MSNVFSAIIILKASFLWLLRSVTCLSGLGVSGPLGELGRGRSSAFGIDSLGVGRARGCGCHQKFLLVSARQGLLDQETQQNRCLKPSGVFGDGSDASKLPAVNLHPHRQQDNVLVTESGIENFTVAPRLMGEQ